ncbi:hypothetical protein TIFTF001_054553 [Ficus carica]|uniref:Uncharacterized protein n=1 Tax=Ficus carica TaxID=3494 RepID=A0AA88EAH4_FICCA|nr:hypothetical protein TIFTF001_054552 [Ficus carica]GMN70948.1 hypothetical protein TIFTF001_054553 [Ficus carica]
MVTLFLCLYSNPVRPSDGMMGRKSFRLVSNGRAKEANLNDQTNPQQGHLPIMYLVKTQTQAFKSKKVAIRRKLSSFFLHRQRSDKKMLMLLTQIQDGKELIGVTTPLPNARSLFFLTSLAEDGTCFSLSFYSCYSFNFFPIAACLASKSETTREKKNDVLFLFGSGIRKE